MPARPTTERVVKQIIAVNKNTSKQKKKKRNERKHAKEVQTVRGKIDT